MPTEYRQIRAHAPPYKAFTLAWGKKFLFCLTVQLAHSLNPQTEEWSQNCAWNAVQLTWHECVREQTNLFLVLSSPAGQGCLWVEGYKCDRAMRLGVKCQDRRERKEGDD